MKRRPDDYAAVVRANHAKTVAWLVAHARPCLRIRDEEIARIDRDLRALGPDDLPGFRPQGSWLLAVILCLEDDVSPLADWTARLPAKDRDRVLFFAHPDTDLVDVLRPWFAAGSSEPTVEWVRGWRMLHPLLGRELNDRVYRDATAGRK